jgi:hypothetical protein
MASLSFFKHRQCAAFASLDNRLSLERSNYSPRRFLWKRDRGLERFGRHNSGTKFLYESGSVESRPVGKRKGGRWIDLLHQHSLLVFLAVTGIGWLVLYLRMNPQDKWGQVVGNIVSEWLQMAGLVYLTKGLIERGSKESR